MRLLLLPLLLAACSGGDEPANNGADEATSTVEPVPSNATLDVQNRVVPLGPAASPTPIAATAFPEPFRGRWGLTATDCDPARADNKGLMTVTADRVSHYESRATPARIEVAGPGKLTAELSFTGEGQEWTRRATWTLVEDGGTLIAETDDPEPPMRSLRYHRCPSQSAA